MVSGTYFAGQTQCTSCHAVSDDLLRPPTHPEVVVLAPPQIQLFVHDTGACGLSHSTWTGGEGSDHTTGGGCNKSRLHLSLSLASGYSSSGLRGLQQRGLAFVRAMCDAFPSVVPGPRLGLPGRGDFTSRPSPAGGDSPSRVGLAGRGRGRGGR